MTLLRLTDPGDPRLTPALELYCGSFPPHELRPLASQQAILSHPDYTFGLLYDGEEFVGLLLYWETRTFRYVEHFCIQPALRGRRYGAHALELLAEDGKPTILEIDPPVDDISTRRRAFYLRCGYYENPWPHVHPPYTPGVPGHVLAFLSHPRPLDEAEYADFAAYLSQVVMSDR